MKRHSAKEHGGNMSRSNKHNAALQIPMNFYYQQSNEEERDGRRRGFRLDSIDNQLSMAIQASLETVNSGLPRGTSSHAQALSNQQDMHDFESPVNSFGSLAATGNRLSSRNHQSLGQNSSNAPLENSSFPPLTVAKKSSRHKSGNGSKGSGGNTVAARHHCQNNGTGGVGSSSRDWSTGIRQTTTSNFSQSRPISNSGVVSSSGCSSTLQNKTTEVLLAPSSYASSSQVRQTTGHGLLMASTASSSRNSSGGGKVSHSSSAPNLAEQRSFDLNVCDFPPLSATQPNILQPLLKVKDAPSANKLLVEKIRLALKFDNDRFIAFKIMSKEYRRGQIDAGEYLGYVHQFGLSHLVLDLASLCPNAQKQKELVETYNYNLRCNNGPHNGSWSSDSSLPKDKKCSKKGKEKCQDNGISSSKDGSSGNNLRKLQPSLKQFEEEMKVLSKDGHQSAKGKAKFFVVDKQTDSDTTNQPVMELRIENDSQPDD